VRDVGLRGFGRELLAEADLEIDMDARGTRGSRGGKEIIDVADPRDVG